MPKYTLKAWTERCTSLAAHKSDATAAHYELVGRRLVEALGDVDLAQVTAGEAADFIVSIDGTDATKAKYTRYAKAIFQRAVREGEVEANPFKHESSRSKRSSKDWTYYDDAIMGRLLTACPSLGWRRLIALCRYAGLRAMEARALAWAQVNGKHVSLVGKGDERRIVPLVPRVLSLMDMRSGDGPCDGLPVGMELSRTAARLSDRAGLGRHSPLHDLRRCCAMDWRRKWGEYRASLALGHSIAVAAAFYDRLEPSDIAQMAEDAPQLA